VDLNNPRREVSRKKIVSCALLQLPTHPVNKLSPSEKTRMKPQPCVLLIVVKKDGDAHPGTHEVCCSKQSNVVLGLVLDGKGNLIN
jgi:hypothetical protein